MNDELTGQEVAQLMKCDPGFVRRLRLDGRLPGLRQVGITWTYSRKAVERFLANWDRRPGSYERKPPRPHRMTKRDAKKVRASKGKSRRQRHVA